MIGWVTIQYFLANDIEDNKKRTATFLTLIGKETYSLLSSLMTPDKPSSKKADELSKILSDHLQPVPIVIAERYKFYSRVQEESESVANYVAELRRLTIHCDFKTFLDEALRDKFVCGLTDSAIRKRLLTEKKLTLTSAVDMAKTMERSASENKLMEPDIKVNVHATKSQVRKKRCYRCDAENHLANVCRHKETICSKCNLKGHLARVCRGNAYRQTLKSYKTVDNELRVPPLKNQSSVHLSRDENVKCESDDENSIYYINKVNFKEPLSVNIQVANKLVRFEIDTGSGLSLISETTFRKYFPNWLLEKTNIIIRTYSNEQLEVLGCMIVNSEYKGNVYPELKLYVVKGGGVNLLGRSWLSVIKLDWDKIFEQYSPHPWQNNFNTGRESPKNELNILLKKHSKIFSEELGTIKGLKAKITVKPDAKPKFCKSRNVPFALQEAVENEIERLEVKGLIKSVLFN